MKKYKSQRGITLIALIITIIILLILAGISISALTNQARSKENTTKVRKIWAVAALIGVACFGGALGMAHSVAKAANNMAEQPEAAEQIRTSMMMGLVFIETVIIYALIVAILIIFVL